MGTEALAFVVVEFVGPVALALVVVVRVAGLSYYYYKVVVGPKILHGFILLLLFDGTG